MPLTSDDSGRTGPGLDCLSFCAIAFCPEGTTCGPSPWQASATAANVCTLPEPLANGDWTECTFNAAGLTAIHRGGRTQVRIHFTTGDNDDAGNDHMGFHGGDATNDADRPELVVTYF